MSGHWSQHQVVSYMSVCLFLFTTQNMSYSFLFISKNIDQIHLSVICINSPPKLQIVAMIVNILIKIDRAAGNWRHFSWSLATFEMLILVLNTVGARNLIPTISAYCLWCLSFPKLEPDYNCVPWSHLTETKKYLLVQICKLKNIYEIQMNTCTATV